MTLGELTAGWLRAEPAALELRGLSADSRQCGPGYLFVALPFLDRAGFRHDGHDFVAGAVARGAVGVIATEAERARRAAPAVPVLEHPDTRWLLPRLAARWYGDPSHALSLVGVTGTNGKTTVTYLICDILEEAGLRTVLAGTVVTRVDRELREATTTTPDPVTLQALWREAADAGITAGAMETSSHALDQHRVDATRFEVGVFTNLTQDHLDYHVTMEDYGAAKARLFAADETGWAPRAVVNVDDPWGRQMAASAARPGLTFGIESADADVRASDVVFDAQGTRFWVTTPAGEWEQRLRLVGRYNVSNALAALSSALCLGVEPEVAAAALSRAAGAPGRLERVDEGQGYLVLVDYAHTPDALENVLRAARGFTSGRVIVTFGCGGDRDRTKRPRMGRLAAELADLVVVTSDNPRTEAAGAVVDDILAGIEGLPRDDVRVEVDRATAIGLALGLAGPGDAVVIAGKGHENYQIIGTTKSHFDDREVAREWLRRHG
ncbi:MAG: UDP-N-acetylmuramoyl-L-alanyl-D-glutamate--2,6-diaminopimelate ligase [Armatimonadetes bacterium]|nr:UDP-N-acetylmuramoyl-L-alanyl-D-glutamate--2,6-diaminopimelate ligase [Armatimonadota bacterium]